MRGAWTIAGGFAVGASLATVLGACARPSVGSRVTEPFRIDAPDGWRAVRSHGVFGNREVVFASPDGRATCAFAWVRLDAASRSMPLDLLAEVRALEQGRSVGFVNVVDDVRWIVLDDRPAVAVTGRSVWRPVASAGAATTAQEGAFSLVVTRTTDRMALVLVSAPSGELDSYVVDLAMFLDGFHILAEPAPAIAPLPDAGE